MTLLYIILALVGIGAAIYWMSQKAATSTIPADMRAKAIVTVAPGDLPKVPLSSIVAPALATLPHSMLTSSMLGFEG